MKEFMMLFRDTPNPSATAPSQADLQAEIKTWNDWIGGIAAQDKYVGGEQLSYEGRIVKANNIVTDGPYAEIKEIIGGYIIVKAADYDEAIEIAKGCPIFDTDGNVEIRDFVRANV